MALRNPWISPWERRSYSEAEEAEEFFPAESGDLDHAHHVQTSGISRTVQTRKRTRDDELIDGQKSMERSMDVEPRNAVASPRIVGLTHRQSKLLPTGERDDEIAARQIKAPAPRVPVNDVASPQVHMPIRSHPLTLPLKTETETQDGAPRSDRLPSIAVREHQEPIESSPSFSGRQGNRKFIARQIITVERKKVEPVVVPTPKRPGDAFHENYEKTMAWFDRVNETYEVARLLMKVLLEDPIFRVEENIPRLQGTPYYNLLRTMENSLEMVYVGQTCLSWEALHRQHVRAKALRFSDDGDGIPCEPTVKKFAVFGDILARYQENEEAESSRLWCYSRCRLSTPKPLQVPEISGTYFFSLQSGIIIQRF